MTTKKKAVQCSLERLINAPAGKVYDAWLDPKVQGTPWAMGDKLILNAKPDGLFFWRVHGTPHYGRFTALKRGRRIEHTWMSPYTLGEESVVRVTFKAKGKKTLMTLVHFGLPNDRMTKKHVAGWTHFMDLFPTSFAKA